MSYHSERPQGTSASPIPDKSRLAPAVGIRFLASRVLFVTSQAAPPPLQSIHALGRVKLRQTSGVLIIANCDKPVIQSPLSPGILRPAPVLPRDCSRSSRDTALSRGTSLSPYSRRNMAFFFVGWPATRPKLPTNTPSKRHDNPTHPTIHQVPNVREMRGDDEVWIASVAYT